MHTSQPLQPEQGSTPYEPPRAEDIDATHGPVAAAAGAQQQSPPQDFQPVK